MASAAKTANGTPAPPASLKKSSSSSKQTSIAGFFKRKESQTNSSEAPRLKSTSLPINGLSKRGATRGSSQSLTPAPSSDAVEPDDIKNEEASPPIKLNGKGPNALPSPITPASVIVEAQSNKEGAAPKGFYSPSRKVWFFLPASIIN